MVSDEIINARNKARQRKRRGGRGKTNMKKKTKGKINEEDKGLTSDLFFALSPKSPKHYIFNREGHTTQTEMRFPQWQRCILAKQT